MRTFHLGAMPGYCFYGLKSKGGCAGEHRANRGSWFVCCLTFDIRFRARRELRSGARRAGSRFGALYHRASRSRARRAFANLTRFRAGRNTRRAFGHRGLQHILGHIGLRRAFRLQHILRHIGHRGARRHRGFQNPFARVGFRAFWTHRLRSRPWCGASTRPGFRAAIASTIIIKPLGSCTFS
jgi:hypothetical protein